MFWVLLESLEGDLNQIAFNVDKDLKSTLLNGISKELRVLKQTSENMETINWP